MSDAIVFTKDNVGGVHSSLWAEYRKTRLARAARIKGAFMVETREGLLFCPDGYLAIDAHGWPYPIAADEFEAIYEPAAPSSVRGGDGRVTPLARIRELSIHDGEEALEQLDEFTYSWFRGHEVLRAGGVEYRGVFHPGDGCCQGNPCRYCGRAFYEEVDPDAA